jgi:hypothetical protein
VGECAIHPTPKKLETPKLQQVRQLQITRVSNVPSRTERQLKRSLNLQHSLIRNVNTSQDRHEFYEIGLRSTRGYSLRFGFRLCLAYSTCVSIARQTCTYHYLHSSTHICPCCTMCKTALIVVNRISAPRRQRLTRSVEGKPSAASSPSGRLGRRPCTALGE